MRVLGIETSCDDTGIAIYDSEKGILVQRLHSQIELHNDYGGVVPELASRDHIRKLMPLIKSTLVESKLSGGELDGIAYTAGPGLAGALLVGAAIGRSLAWTWQIPAIGIHHMEGHLLSALLDEETVTFPFLALLVSGGHTLLAEVKSFGQYKIIGDTLDDAVGEAFDKTAQLLDLGYPGGPAIEKAANHGVANRFTFPRPMSQADSCNFSFSGLKTAVATEVNKQSLDAQMTADIALAFQQAAIDTLAIKCKKALDITGCRQLIVAGGVSANGALRLKLDELGKSNNIKILFPRPDLSTDNGAMIAFAGAKRLAAGQHEDLDFNIFPRWKLDTLKEFV